jgi:mRNA interferase MazF
VVETSPRQGDLWFAQLNPVVGHEQGGIRPVLVVSGDHFNSLPSELLTVLPLTSRDRGLAWHFRLDEGTGGLSKTSFVLCEQIRTISMRRLARKIGSVHPSILNEVMEIVFMMLSS